MLVAGVVVIVTAGRTYRDKVYIGPSRTVFNEVLVLRFNGAYS